MGDWAIRTLVIGFFAWAFWSILQPQYAFEIRIEGGQANARKGKVTSTFLVGVAEICQECGVNRGWIAGVRRGRRIALRFSRHFPRDSRQRLRNEWQAAT
jgi:hypothetical protein